MNRHKVFISYRHENDQQYKKELLKLNDAHRIFIDGSVDTDDISDDLDDQAIRAKIRDDYLRDTTVTIVLFGLETKKRKHVDWEIFSSMIDGTVNKKSGVIAVNLPSTGSVYCTAPHEREKELYPEFPTWISISEPRQYGERYPYLSDRIIDNLLKSQAKLSVMPWSKIVQNPDNLRFLIEAAWRDRRLCEYDLSRPMRRHNS